MGLAHHMSALYQVNSNLVVYINTLSCCQAGVLFCCTTPEEVLLENYKSC